MEKGNSQSYRVKQHIEKASLLEVLKEINIRDFTKIYFKHTCTQQHAFFRQTQTRHNAIYTQVCKKYIYEVFKFNVDFISFRSG